MVFVVGFFYCVCQTVISFKINKVVQVPGNKGYLKIFRVLLCIVDFCFIAICILFKIFRHSAGMSVSFISHTWKQISFLPFCTILFPNPKSELHNSTFSILWNLKWHLVGVHLWRRFIIWFIVNLFTWKISVTQIPGTLRKKFYTCTMTAYSKIKKLCSKHILFLFFKYAFLDKSKQTFFHKYKDSIRHILYK